MNLYMFAESEDLAELVKNITGSIEEWLAARDSGSTTNFANHRYDENAADNETTVSRPWELGLTLKVKSKAELKEPLNFLYSVAKQNKCEFVVGIIVGDLKEDICYFGHEEGRPDMHEVAMYLGL